MYTANVDMHPKANMSFIENTYRSPESCTYILEIWMQDFHRAHFHCGIDTFCFSKGSASFFLHDCVETNVQLIWLLVQTVEDNYK